jgi:hypothetical protein
MENLIDFSDPILRLVLPILLKDQTTGKNIIWATDPPPNVDCGPMGEITIEQLDRIKLMPRVQKRLSEQKKRTRGKAEVFTPLWVVKKMADHAEQELNKGNWEQFVHERCLEITCGEAPFLTSRYDPTTGEPVAIPDRVGILDRKLRAIQENANHKFQWKALVSSAYQSVYGYEYQGDNLLLARVNLFLTFTENWIEKLGLPISASWAIAVATRISWNIWQMDGLKDTAPGTDTLCLIYDWEKNEEVTFRQIKEESDNV